MPDPRRLYRRVTESNLPTRVIAHISVVSLVAVASLAGLSQTQAPGTADADSVFLALVQSVRGAAEGASVPQDAFGFATLPENETTLLDRAARVEAPVDDPLATPVPIDPNATPLPAPNANVGGTTTGASARGAAPPVATGALVWPVPAGSISQYYHAGHLALDIAAPYGSQIVAAQGGTVTWAGWRNNGGGYVISINHGNGMSTVYNHLGSIWVSPGQYVGAGQGIGGVGCTGICTGPHVHFEVIVNGVIDNPLRYF
ncbi:MAG TPA: M23 family metallopeptidase [Candidatus Limnocylindria bacterium]